MNKTGNKIQISVSEVVKNFIQLDSNKEKMEEGKKLEKSLYELTYKLSLIENYSKIGVEVLENYYNDIVSMEHISRSALENFYKNVLNKDYDGNFDMDEDTFEVFIEYTLDSLVDDYDFTDRWYDDLIYSVSDFIYREDINKFAVWFYSHYGIAYTASTDKRSIKLDDGTEIEIFAKPDLNIDGEYIEYTIGSTKEDLEYKKLQCGLFGFVKNNNITLIFDCYNKKEIFKIKKFSEEETLQLLKKIDFNSFA